MLITLPNAFGDAATNMAIDAALLETLPAGGVVFRHYGWTQPAVTFGYSQHHDEVAAHTPHGVDLCRRLTGGGIVDHRNDWTYALVIHREANCACLSSTDLYAKIHAALAEALARQKIATRLAPCPRKCDEAATQPNGPDRCFVRPVMNDVLDPHGRKIAGAAMKRTRRGLLIQGSMDYDPLPADFNQMDFSKDFTMQLAEALQLPRHQPDDLRGFFDSKLIAEEKARFGSWEWTRRR